MDKTMQGKLCSAVVVGGGLDKNTQPDFFIGKFDENSKYPMCAILDANETLAQITSAIAKVIGSSPEALDTLEELADALEDNPNYIKNIKSQVENMNNPEIEGSLQNQITENEQTIATALNDLNTRIEELESKVATLEGN